MGAAARWLLPVSCVLVASIAACRGGAAIDELDADDGDGSAGDGDGDTDVDVDADVDIDADADGDVAPDPDGDLPECQYDEGMDFEMQCIYAKIDVARDVPGGGDRVRYHMPVSPPAGDYDPRCARMNDVRVTARDGTVVRRGEAYYDPESGGFVLEGPAVAAELATCESEERVAVFEIHFQGESPGGTFWGECGCGCLSWTLSLACHHGLEASIAAEAWVGDEFMYEGAAMIDGRGVVGNHGAGPLTDLRVTRTSWRTQGDVVPEMDLVPPTWEFSGLWLDWVDAGTWSWEEYLTWTSETEPPPEALCPGSTSGLDPPRSQIILHGTHSEGSFEVETHPFWCWNYEES